jgi:hypothetical protein
MKKFLIEKLMRPRWIVNNRGELGIRVLGINFWYYKRAVPMIALKKDKILWQEAVDREFGIVIKSQMKLSHYETEEQA